MSEKRISEFELESEINTNCKEENVQVNVLEKLNLKNLEDDKKKNNSDFYNWYFDQIVEQTPMKLKFFTIFYVVLHLADVFSDYYVLVVEYFIQGKILYFGISFVSIILPIIYSCLVNRNNKIISHVFICILQLKIPLT
jgi:hypothetical protein